ncbi:uncharacterized protein LOC110983511 [Acanthaster planci]|uniref:Uncharacterized protein LOC110983511 n=1 Tax=Acanthaster planci TaxID=133434 RepID=A0A8B7Z0M6_ACAPL|nr:uncharacterized protein LOC110983511 [Acanthaster planci]
MAFFRIVLAFLMFVCGVHANWDEKSDPSRAEMGFVAVNTTCNDAGTSCAKCIEFPVLGKSYLVVMEYTRHPFNFHCKNEEADADGNVYFNQNDLSEPFRVCAGVRTPHYMFLGTELRTNYCFDNDFSKIDVPSDCVEPILIMTIASFIGGHDKALGEQVLYCQPT